MKHWIILSTLLFSLVIVKAENREETMGLLAKKLEFESPDYDLVDEKTMNLRDEFMRKNRWLFNSLGKEEIFYHLDLTSELYNEDRPGPQPHAVYASYLYSKFYSDYTAEEKKLISKNLEDFAEKGWLGKQGLENFQAAAKTEKKPSPIPTRPPNVDRDQRANNLSQAKKSEENQNNLTPVQKQEKKSSLPWVIAGVLLVGILALLFKVFKGKSTS